MSKSQNNKSTVTELKAMWENKLKNKQTKSARRSYMKPGKHTLSDFWENRFKTTTPELIDGPKIILTSAGNKTNNNTIIKPTKKCHSMNDLWKNKFQNNQHTSSQAFKDKLNNIITKKDVIEEKEPQNETITNEPVQQNCNVNDHEYNVLDTQFNSNGYFSISNDKKIATFIQKSNVLPNLYDYCYYPACRISKVIDLNDAKSQTVRFKLFQYGWFGIGSHTVTPHGFPGYTNSGWMIRVSDCGAWYNNHADTMGCNGTGNLTNQVITMKYMPNTKQLTVIAANGQKYVYTHNDMPPSKQAYFVFTMASGKVQIFD